MDGSYYGWGDINSLSHLLEKQGTLPRLQFRNVQCRQGGTHEKIKMTSQAIKPKSIMNMLFGQERRGRPRLIPMSVYHARLLA